MYKYLEESLVSNILLNNFKKIGIFFIWSRIHDCFNIHAVESAFTVKHILNNIQKTTTCNV